MWKIKKRWVSQPANSSSQQWKDHILLAALVPSSRHIFTSPSEKNGFLPSCLLLHSFFVSVFLSGTSRQVREKAGVLIGSSPGGTHRHLPLSSVFICEYDCHSSHRITERPISTGLFLYSWQASATSWAWIVCNYGRNNNNNNNSNSSLDLVPCMMHVCILPSYLPFSSSDTWRV